MRVRELLKALLSDESGAEVLEYAIVTGLITVAALGVVAKFGMKVVSNWKNVKQNV